MAVENVSLSIPAGSTTVLLGPSGCGKSTLLRAVVGLISPDEGEILIEGTRLSPANADTLRRHMGYVIQEGGLFPHLTARENITLLPRVLGWSSERISARVQELCAMTQLQSEYLARFPSQLSGGQRQRVSLMRALVLDPGLLLLDEPLGALDPIVRRELQRELREIFKRLRKTVLLVTHDLGEAGYLADRIVLMRDGHIIQQGALADLVERPADPFVTQFINAQRSPLETLQLQGGVP